VASAESVSAGMAHGLPRQSTNERSKYDWKGFDMTEFIGWTSSAILVVTIYTQVRRQWVAGTSKGVSKWLFVGQLAASFGFAAYSFLIRNWVFVVTNALLACAALAGIAIVILHRRKERASTGLSAHHLWRA